MHRIFDTEVKKEPGIFRLSWQNFGTPNLNLSKKTADFISNLSNMPKDTIHLDVSGNNFGVLTIDALIQIINSINQPIQSINLSFNNFYKISSSHFIQLMSRLPPSIHELDLANNKLGHLSLQHLRSFINTLPKSIQIINMAFNTLNPQQEKLLAELTNETKRQVLTSRNTFKSNIEHGL